MVIFWSCCYLLSPFAGWVLTNHFLSQQPPEFRNTAVRAMVSAMARNETCALISLRGTNYFIYTWKWLCCNTTYIYIYIYICICIYLSRDLSIYLSIYLSLSLSLYIYIFVNIYICKYENITWLLIVSRCLNAIARRYNLLSCQNLYYWQKPKPIHQVQKKCNLWVQKYYILKPFDWKKWTCNKM